MFNSIYEWILLFISITTTLLQFYVIWLIQCRSPFTMQEYRFFLTNFTFWDMIFTLALGIGLQPDSVPNMLAAWCRGLSSYFGPYAMLYTLSFVIFAGANAVLVQNYCLMYRFTVIHNNRNVHTLFMSTKCKFAWFGVVESIAVMLGILMYFSCVPPQDLPRRISQLSLEFQLILPVHEFIFWIDVDKQITHIFMFIMLFLFVLVETSCTILVYLILSTLKRKAAKFSRNTYRLHLQLTTLLTVQLLTPFLFIIVPVALCLIFAFMGQFSAQLVGRIGFLFIEVYAMVNSLCTIAFVTPYRMHAWKKLIHIWPFHCCPRNTGHRVTASSVQSGLWVTANKQ